MKSATPFFFIWISIVITSCNSNAESNNTLETRSADSLHSEMIVDHQFDFSNPEVSNDTFKIVNQSSYFYNCYGVYKNPIELKRLFSVKYNIKEEITPAYSDSTVMDTLYRISSKGSYLKYYYANSEDEEEQMNVVSGKITTSDFEMTNGIKVGMKKGEVLKRIFYQQIPSNLDQFDKIQVITGLQGVWVNFFFENNKLVSVSIDTDYLVGNKY